MTKRKPGREVQVGDTIGRLLVVQSIWITNATGRKRGWLCVCSCEERTRVVKHNHVLRVPLLRGEHSCGCAQTGVPRGPEPGRQRNNGRKCVPDPTPEEIQQVCWEIQAGWTDEERARRTGLRPTGWEVPVISTGASRDQTREFH